MSSETPQDQTVYEALIARAWADPAFRKALLSSPRETIARELGAAIPPEVEIEVVEETPTRLYVVLPAAPPAGAAGELSEADLGAVAGGSAACATIGLFLRGTSATHPLGPAYSSRVLIQPVKKA